MLAQPPIAVLEDSSLTEQTVFMREALAMSRAALENGEIPVGCVIVEHRDVGCKIVAAGSNQTNASRNGTRHAEIVAVESLYKAESTSVLEDVVRVHGSKSRGVLSNCDLYVTCEPCIMCAAALSKLGIRKVYFGCHNDRFGGNGSILSVHTDAYSSSMSTPHTSSHSAVGDSPTSSVSSSIVSTTDQVTVTCNSYHKYDVEAGLLKEEAIELFQHFYTSENRRAPEAKRKRKVDKTFNSGAPNLLNNVCQDS